ncbi:MAG: BatA domain-containing protein [Planctomycetes bacterium]|nr:BatA domain-containing protein [Planctomycetota bacterium]
MGSSFLHGALAWATLGLVTIPIIIHLINRRRFRRIDWAAMEFLLEALKKSRRRIQIEQLLLLLLRVALMASLGLFLARPVLSERGLEWLASALRSEEKVFILDDSFSTSEREADRTAFQRASDAVQGQVRRLAERGGGDRLTVLRGTRPRQPLLRGAFVDRERAAALSQALARLSPTDARMSLGAALEAVLEAAAAAGEAPRPRAIAILTDLRASEWTDGRGGPDDGVRRALVRLAESPDAPARISVLDVGTEGSGNVAIAGLSVEGGRPVADIPCELRVDVRNFGLSAVRGLGLRVRYAPAGSSGPEAQATAVGPAIDELPPGPAMPFTVPVTFRSAGHHGVTVELTGNRDALPGDDAAHLAVEVVTAIEVLLVDGEPSSEPFAGETDFIAAALAPGGEVSSGLKPQVVVEENVPRGGLERYAAVVLANLHSVPAELLEPLGRYVRAGGTLVLFPGDQADPALWSRQLGDLGNPPAGEPPPARGILPARLGALEIEQDPVGISPSLDHPYFRLLRDASDLLGSIRFEKRFVLEPVAGAQVIARHTDAAASPALVEHAVERGRVLLASSSCDLEWNDWARNPSYLMALQEVVAVAARSGREGAGHRAGTPVEVPVDVAVHSREARLRLPGHPAVPERSILAAPAPPREGEPGGAGFRFSIDETDRAGLYALALKGKSGEEEWLAIGVARDPAESDPARVSAARLRELYPEVEIAVLRDPAGIGDVGRGRFEASDFLLWAFAVLLFAEALLARLFAHHPPPRPAAGGGTS